MKNAVRFFYIEVIRCRAQLWFFILFFAIALYTGKNNPFFSVSYMCFCGVIMSVQPFQQEQLAESGFLNMLPGTKRERVCGRYLFGLGMILVSALLGMLVLLLGSGMEHQKNANLLPVLVTCIGITLIVLSFQYVLFYAMGKIKSQQFAGLIMMAPGFIFFFGMNFLLGKMQKNNVDILYWWMKHMEPLAWCVLLLGILLWIGSMRCAVRLIQKRDFL
ncbi:MAG: ABC-2 transporter permease [Lachnospiraceae bacterium]|nr:ABC-2 transporter permease [Lachnospiraceae bacterium]